MGCATPSGSGNRAPSRRAQNPVPGRRRHYGCVHSNPRPHDALLARVPDQDVALKRSGVWASLGYHTDDGHTVSFAAWADNLFAVGHSVDDAASILQDAELHLMRDWQLAINTDSKQCLTAAGSLAAAGMSALQAKNWEVVRRMRVLGYIVSDDASHEHSWQHSKAGVWKALWGNLAKGKHSMKRKIILLNRVALPVILFQFMIWTWSMQLAKRIDALQAHLVARMLDLVPREGESRLTYLQRRNRQGFAYAKDIGRWSYAWSRRLEAWSEHLQRHPQCWISRILATQNASWLQSQRDRWATPTNAQRTHTRVARARVHRRYEAGLTEWTAATDLRWAAKEPRAAGSTAPGDGTEATGAEEMLAAGTTALHQAADATARVAAAGISALQRVLGGSGS